MIVPDDSTSAHDDSSDLVLMRVLLLAVKQTRRVATDDELRDTVDALLSARA